MVQTLISRTQRTAAATIHTGGVFKPRGAAHQPRDVRRSLYEDDLRPKQGALKFLADSSFLPCRCRLEGWQNSFIPVS